MITARRAHRGLFIRMLIQISGKDVEASFLPAQFSYIGLKMARQCYHNPRAVLGKAHSKRVIKTSVAAAQGAENITSITMTHGNGEAQFLCCGYGNRIILQSGCCLTCAVQQAAIGEFSMVIQE
jgi:hypothetical protein